MEKFDYIYVFDLINDILYFYDVLFFFVYFYNFEILNVFIPQTPQLDYVVLHDVIVILTN